MPTSLPERRAPDAEPVPRSDDRARRRLVVRGVVQGVGFRPFVHALAHELGLAGWVLNDGAGVVLEIEGARAALDAFAARLVAERPPLAAIAHVQATDVAVVGEAGFVVRASRAAAGTPAGAAGIPPDVATCDACLAELHDPRDRRHRYPFVNCTHCGPRFTIVRGTPYDRPRTTMAAFAMCDACAREYHDPADRRFHAQPVACPACGPRVWHERADAPCPALDAPRAALPDGVAPPPRDDAAIAATIAALHDGAIVAVKGIGGFHLACDARHADAVARLRARKQRPAKPFAVMARDAAQAREFARVDAAAEAALTDRARPIVLLPARGDADAPDAAPLAAGVAPGVGLVGVMLPYAPLHALLADAMPLVLTSGNLSDEPIAIDNAEARARLGAIADAFLMHDRPIHTACDDSVVRVLDGTPAPVRRSRGYAPLAVTLATEGAPVLAAGGDLKAVCGVALDERAILGPHVGDLEALETQRALDASARHLLAAYRVTPAAVACDLHPGYHGARWAAALADSLGVPLVRVQHHHAHAAATLAEHGRARPDGADGRALALTLDGTGYGTDGAIWGGELLAADARGFARLAHLAYVPLPGGDAAARRPRRAALAHLRAAGAAWDDALPCVRATPAVERGVLARQLATGTGCVPTSSAGRLLDAVAALCDVRQETTYEGEAAMALEAAAADALGGAGLDAIAPYAFASRAVGDGTGAPAPLDVASLVAGVARDVTRGASAGEVAARAHATLAALALESCRRARAATGLGTVALGGGVLQNALLLGALRAGLAAEGFEVLAPRLVPANDGGLALGQLVVARAALHAGGPATS